MTPKAEALVALDQAAAMLRKADKLVRSEWRILAEMVAYAREHVERIEELRYPRRKQRVAGEAPETQEGEAK